MCALVQDSTFIIYLDARLSKGEGGGFARPPPLLPGTPLLRMVFRLLSCVNWHVTIYQSAHGWCTSLPE